MTIRARASPGCWSTSGLAGTAPSGNVVVGDAAGTPFSLDSRGAVIGRFSGRGPITGAVALDAAGGRPLLDAALESGMAAAPLVAGGRVIVATRGGDVVAYEGPES